MQVTYLETLFEIDTKQILKQEHLCTECRNEYNLKKQKENFIAKSCLLNLILLKMIITNY